MASRRSIALLMLGTVRDTTILRKRAWTGLHAQRRQASRPAPTPSVRDRRSQPKSAPSNLEFRKRGENLVRAELVFDEADFETMPGIQVEVIKSNPSVHNAALALAKEFVSNFAVLCCASGAYELQTPTLNEYEKLLREYEQWYQKLHADYSVLTLLSIGGPHVRWMAEQLLDSYHTNEHLRMLAQHLLKIQMMRGDVDAAMILLLYVGYRRQDDQTITQLVESARVLLRKALKAQPIASVWRIAVLEGMILESRGLLDEALRMYKIAMKGQRQSLSISEAANSGELSEQVRSAPELKLTSRSQYIELLETPWNNAIECYSKKSETKGAHVEAMKQEARKMVDMAVLGDDARRMRDAAVLSHREYRAEQWAEEFDESLGMTRVPRFPEKMHGTSARWLYYMTKSAQMLVPKACCDLGRYYASVPWPFLDEEPPDSVKPTSFDRYPQRPSGSHILTRLARAIGIPGTRKTAYEDTFHSASLPATADVRMLLAVDWLEIAAELGYAPALGDLLQIYTSETVSVQKSVPGANVNLSNSRYEYHSKAKYWSELDDSDNDIDRTPITRSTIKNPTFSEEKAKHTVLRTLSALEALRVHQLPPVGRKLVYEPEKWLPWLRKASFTEWCYDEQESNQLKRAVQSVCEEKAWSEYKDYRRTIAES